MIMPELKALPIDKSKAKALEAVRAHQKAKIAATLRSKVKGRKSQAIMISDL